MQIEIQELKNKVSKTQGSDVYLKKKKNQNKKKIRGNQKEK
jgi:hypothetical protein